MELEVKVLPMGESREYTAKGEPIKDHRSEKRGGKKGIAKGRAWTNFKVSAVIVNQYVPEKLDE